MKQPMAIMMLMLLYSARVQSAFQVATPAPAPESVEGSNTTCKSIDEVLSPMEETSTIFSFLMEVAGMLIGMESTIKDNGVSKPLIFAPTDDFIEDVMSEWQVEEAVSNATNARRMLIQLNQILMQAAHNGTLQVAVPKSDAASFQPNKPSDSTVVPIEDEDLKLDETMTVVAENSTLQNYDYILFDTCRGGLVVPLEKQYATRMMMAVPVFVWGFGLGSIVALGGFASYYMGAYYQNCRKHRDCEEYDP